DGEFFGGASLPSSHGRHCMLRRRASTCRSSLPHSVLHLRVTAGTSYLILTIIHETVVLKGKNDDGGCWFAWWCCNRELPEPPLRHREFTVVSSHRRCSLSSPEFIRLPKTKPYPSLDLSSGPFPLPRKEACRAGNEVWKQSKARTPRICVEEHAYACYYILIPAYATLSRLGVAPWPHPFHTYA
ncbi:hypothetical protein PIB30_105320, partial [Stylosanthes scabra]|nr:hypothetical protein [Stylosanthes scabra]